MLIGGSRLSPLSFDTDVNFVGSSRHYKPHEGREEEAVAWLVVLGQERSCDGPKKATDRRAGPQENIEVFSARLGILTSLDHHE